MAFNNLFLGISRSLLSPAIRCRRAFEGPISAVRNGENSILGHLAGGQFRPLLRFSSRQSPVKGIPDDFPFTIVDEIGKTRLTLKREYGNGEIITVDARAFAEERHIGYEFNEKKWKWDHLEMNVSICCGGSKHIEIGITGYPEPESDTESDDWMKVNSISMSTEDPHGHLEEFDECLESRGICPGMIKHLFAQVDGKKETSSAPRSMSVGM